MILFAYKFNQPFFLWPFLPFLSLSFPFPSSLNTYLSSVPSLGAVLRKGRAVTYKDIMGRNYNMVSVVLPLRAYNVTPL